MFEVQESYRRGNIASMEILRRCSEGCVACQYEREGIGWKFQSSRTFISNAGLKCILVTQRDSESRPLRVVL